MLRELRDRLDEPLSELLLPELLERLPEDLLGVLLAIG